MKVFTGKKLRRNRIHYSLIKVLVVHLSVFLPIFIYTRVNMSLPTKIKLEYINRAVLQKS